jgi:hypothetical protein
VAMPNGDGFGFDFGSIADFLLGELAAAIEAILQFLVDLVAALGRVFNIIFGQTQFLYGFTLGGLTEVFKSLKQILDDVIHGHLILALGHLRDLIAKIQAWAKKLKAWLDKLQKIHRQLQVKALKDFINLIQRIRQVLVIFRIFHVKWAQKLDAWLGNIEGTVIRKVTLLDRKVNEIITYINILLDPEVLLRQSILAQSLYRYLRGLRGVLGIPESRPLTVDEQTRQQQDRDLLKRTPQLTDPAVQRILAGLDAAAQEFTS